MKKLEILQHYLITLCLRGPVSHDQMQKKEHLHNTRIGSGLLPNPGHAELIWSNLFRTWSECANGEASRKKPTMPS